MGCGRTLYHCLPSKRSFSVLEFWNSPASIFNSITHVYLIQGNFKQKARDGYFITVVNEVLHLFVLLTVNGYAVDFGRSAL